MNSFENFGGFEAGSAGAEEEGVINPLESRWDARSILLGDMKKFMDPETKDGKSEDGATEESRMEDSGIREVEAEGNKNETEEPEAFAAGDIEYSQWIKDVAEYMLEYGNDPDEMQEFWLDFDNNFEGLGEKGRVYAEKMKYEILTQVAARNLVKDFGEDLAEDGWNIEVEIKPSTPEQDLGKGINFWAQMKVNGEEKIIPCHAIYVDINPGASRKDAEKSKAMLKFVADNFISFERPGNGRNYNKSSSENGQFSGIIRDLEEYWEEEVGEFFKDNKGEGVFITLPINKESALFSGEKSRSPRAILPTGKVNDSLHDGFMKNTRLKREYFVQSLS